MGVVNLEKPWNNGSLFMSTFDIENYATHYTQDKVITDLLISCKTADDAILKILRKL